MKFPDFIKVLMAMLFAASVAWGEPVSITVKMSDSGQDGWNGAALRINVNGTYLSPNLTMSIGSESFASFEVNPGDAVQFYWVRGSYDNECKFDVYYTEKPDEILLSKDNLISFANGAFLGEFTVAMNNIPYIDENETPQIKNDVKPMGTNAAAFNAGWYLIRGTFTNYNSINISGDVHFILEEGSNLTVSTIIISSGSTLSIHTQPEKSGMITTNGITVLGSGSLAMHGNAIILASTVSDVANGNKTGGILVAGTTTHWYCDEFSLSQNITIPSGRQLEIIASKTLTIPNGITLTNNGTAINRGIVNHDAGDYGSWLGNPYIVPTKNIDLSESNPSTIGIGWTYSSNIYTILDGADVTITGTGANQRSIVVDASATANIKLKDAAINIPNSYSPITLNSNANVTLTLEGENSLRAVSGYAVIANSNAALTITGTGRLVAVGGIAGKLTMNGSAVVVASSISDGAPTLTGGILFVINMGNVYTEGDDVTAYFPETDVTAKWAYQGKSGIDYESGAIKGFIAVPVTLKINNVPYIVEGTTGTANNVTVIDAANIATVGTDLNGWYLVQGVITHSTTLTVSDKANIILEDGSDLTVTGSSNNAGINVSTGKSLAIYAQSTGDNMGKLKATGAYYGAGIGGGNVISSGAGTNGTITIYGGAVTAIGGPYSAGIGGGGSSSYSYNGGSGGTVTINGGIITATGSTYAAGIGGGGNASYYYSCGSGGTVTINGGVVTATGGYDASGIGADKDNSCSQGSLTMNGNAIVFASSVGPQNTPTKGILFNGNNGTFYGTNITISQNATIPESRTLTIPAGSTLTIPSGLKLTNNGTVIKAGTINHNGEDYGEWAGNPYIDINGFSYIDANGDKQTASDVTIIHSGNISTIGNLSGWYLVAGTITHNSTLRVSGTAHIILADGSDLTVTGSSTNAGINIPSGNYLTIYAQSTGNDMGKLKATGAYYGAGIGGGNDGGNDGSNGIVTINGGAITAIGGHYSAGIGGGGYFSSSSGGNGGTITINGGIVTATGRDYAAGIGGGGNYPATGPGYYFGGGGGSVSINGGVVTATGGVSAQGIGRGSGWGSEGTLSMNGNAIVFASSVGPTNAMTKGILFAGNSGTFYGYGTNIIISQDVTIPLNHTLIVPAGCILTIPSGITLTNNGSVMNAGTIHHGGSYGEWAGNPYFEGFYYLNATGETQSVSDISIIHAGNITANHYLYSGWYFVYGDITHSNTSIIVSGDAHVILADGSNLNVMASSNSEGINVSSGNSLSIYAQSTGSNVGKLNATGDFYGAGIGSNSSCGRVTINGGIITATGGSYAAGIGGSQYGGGCSVTINGGTVIANGGTSAQGIGRGSDPYYYSAGTFTMNRNAIVFASSIGDTDTSKRTGGILFVGNNGGIFYGKSVAIEQDVTINNNFLTIPSGHTLTVQSGVTLTNYNKIIAADSSTVIFKGTLVGSKIEGANVSPKLLMKTATSVTFGGMEDLLASTGQMVEYAMSEYEYEIGCQYIDSSDWQTKPTFTGLAIGKQYYMCVRSKENDNFRGGTISAIRVQTLSTPIISHASPMQSATPQYYTLRGKPLGTKKPTTPGMYIEKSGHASKKIVVQ